MESIEKQELIKLLKSSYRKYKTQIYYDNYSSIQRFKLAEFEYDNFRKVNNNSFIENFNTFFENFAENILNDFNKVITSIVSNISVISIPKSFKEEDDKNNNKIISNFTKFNEKLNKIHYFIDLPVEGHILGVLWILRCGYVLDDKLYSHCYGNRLNDALLNILKEDGEFNDFTPFLFKPYFKNYQSWRDNGLDSLKTILNNNHNAFMLSLDFTDYYYRSLINFDDLKKDIKLTLDTNSNYEKRFIDFDEKLTDFIKLVFEGYSEKFYRKISNEANYPKNMEYDDNFNYKQLPMIPLGFLPSLIISNWNLQGFDQVILENIHPFYYGRYVDDILIVLESHEKSDSFGKQHLYELNLDKFLEKYFTPEGENPFNEILLCSEDMQNEKEDTKDKTWHVFNQPIFKDKSMEDSFLDYYHYENLEIQNKKLRVYKFSHKCSDSIIKNFRSEIYKNSSEFRLMHSMDYVINNLEENIYKINYKESINKLNDINDVGINKYEISKILSRLNHSSKSMYDEEIPYSVVKEVKNAFQGQNIEFMILWEKLFSFLYINDYFEDMLSLTKEIMTNIKNIKLCIGQNNNEKSKTFDDKSTYNFLLKSTDEGYDFDSEKENLNKSLYIFLYSSLIRTLSLKRNKNYINKFKKLFEDESYIPFDICLDIKKYLFSSMQNNNLMKYPLMDTTILSENNENYDLIKYKNNYYNLFNGIFPRFIKFNEFIFHEINNELFSKKNVNSITENENCDDSINNFEPYIQNALINYDKFNFGIGCKIFTEDTKTSIHHLKNNLKPIFDFEDKTISKNENCEILNIASPKKDVIKVGLVNTKLNKNDCINRLKNKPNLSYKRFDAIKDLINESIKKHVDLLVMPEMFIPIEWVNEIVKISKDHQMAIIFGLEPIINKEYVGNYIMATLPFLVSDKYSESLLTYRLKNHYSPEELKQFKKYDKIPIINTNTKYYLFIWNEIYIAPYYCYEIADIQNRSIFKNYCDIITVSEFNKDTLYFSNIAESLSRDLFCYCIKSNTSEYGGSIILQPSSSQDKYLVNLKGGEDDYIVTHKLNIKKLREDAIKNDNYSEDSYFKPKPPGFNKDIIKKRMHLE